MTRFVSAWLLRSCLVVAALLSLGTRAEAIDIPELHSPVTDLAGVLDPSVQSALVSKLNTYEQATGHQFVLLIIPTLDGDPVEDFSIRTFEKNKIGAKQRDDGLLLLVVQQDHKTRIEVGYGLEGEITDAFSKDVLSEVLKPAFRAGREAEGIDRAFDLLMAKGRGISVGVPRRQRGEDLSGRFPLVLIVIVVILMFRFFGGGGGGGGRRRRGGVVFLPGGFGGWGGGGGGFGGGFGGGGGGGWSGGGGGGGGGGASGDW